MTSPMPATPWSVQYTWGSDPTYMEVVAGQRTGSETSYYPGPGVYMVTMSYDGPEKLDMWWLPNGTWTPHDYPLSIPAASGRKYRQSGIVTLSATTSAARLLLTPMPKPPLGSPAQATVTFYPLSTEKMI